MWEIDNNFQVFSFLLSMVAGVCFCIVYDVLRAVRKIKPVTDLAVFFQDIFYFILIGFITFLMLMVFSNGEIRGYIICGIILGFIICFLTLSKLTLKFFIIVFGFIYNVNFKIVDFLNLIIDKMCAFLIKNIKKGISLLNNLKNIKKST